MRSQPSKRKAESERINVEHEDKNSKRLKAQAVSGGHGFFSEDSKQEISPEKLRFREAVTKLKQADYARACAFFTIGTYYEEGVGVEKNEKRAAELYQLAAPYGLAEAQLRLGRCYQDGIGVGKDEEHAAELYQQAAAQGLAEAQYCLAHCYHEGDGPENGEVEYDPKRAVELYEQAAVQGHAKAQYNLADCYRSGEWVLKNRELAYELSTAAEEAQKRQRRDRNTESGR